MNSEGIILESLPSLNQPFFLAGFDGWGNALNVSKGMTAYLIKKFNAKPFARLNQDLFYRYDQSRPQIRIRNGLLKEFSPPQGTFFAAHTEQNGHDLVILEADEPNLRWFQFTNELLSLCSRIGVETVFTLGSMYDSVLPSDRIVSAMASDKALFDKLSRKNIQPINYHGPGAIHSVIQSQGARQGFACISLWGHCPYYIQGVTHYGLLIHLGALLAELGKFTLDTSDLDTRCNLLNQQIEKLIKKNQDIQTIIDKLRKTKVRGSLADMKLLTNKEKKVINLRDFLDLK
jgi:proteasome assembly chaperone (PAC2) family protein